MGEEVLTVHVSNMRQDPRVSIAVAAVASVGLAVLFWVWERDMLWMLGALLPPIWIPVVYQQTDQGEASGTKPGFLAFVLGGLVLLAFVALVVFLVVTG